VNSAGILARVDMPPGVFINLRLRASEIFSKNSHWVLALVCVATQDSIDTKSLVKER